MFFKKNKFRTKNKIIVNFKFINIIAKFNKQIKINLIFNEYFFII